MIEPRTIQQIFDTADIVDVVSEFVNLKKAGANFRGYSPFNDEKTPSFMVSPSKGLFKDFSSGKGGNVVTFLMEHEKLNYPEALKYLAKKYNIEIKEKEKTPEEIKQDTVRESLFIVSNYANKYFQQNLMTHDEGIAVGLSYFKHRGFNEKVIKKFELGYCLDQKSAFTDNALENGYKKEYLVQTGLTIDKESYYFDRFSSRVMFPIHSLSGKVVGFGGRTLKTDKKIAKYLNSPESEIYHKSDELYGIFFAKNAITKNDKCYLVEGYTDVISFHQSGIENVVASSGTALTAKQVNLIKRFTPNLTIIFDGDEAGIKASIRGTDIALEQGLNVKVLLLPEGEDPDSFSKSMSSSELETYITKNETDFINFKTKLLLKDSENDPVKKARVINEIVHSISIIPDGITRTLYVRECSRLMDIEEAILHAELGKIIQKKKQDDFHRKRRQDIQQNIGSQDVKSEDRAYQPVTKKYDDIAEREIIRLMLMYGNADLFYQYNEEEEVNYPISVAQFLLNAIEEDDLKFTNAIYQKIFEELRKINHTGKEIVARKFTMNPDENISLAASEILTENGKYDLSKIWFKNDNFFETEDMKLREIVPETVHTFKSKKIQLSWDRAKRDLESAYKVADNEKIYDLTFRIQIINEIKNELARNLNNRVIFN